MTIGYPDYQNYPQWRGPVFASGSKTITSVAPFTVSEVLTNYASTYLNSQITSGTGYTVKVQFYADAAHTLLVHTYSWIISSAVELSVLIPNVTSFAQFSMTTAQAGSQGGELFIAPTNVPVGKPVYPNTGCTASGLSVAIGAAGSLSTVLPSVIEGIATLSLESSNLAATQRYIISALGENALAAYRLSGVITFTTVQNITFAAPNAPVQLEIDNQSAGSLNYDYFLNVQNR